MMRETERRARSGYGVFGILLVGQLVLAYGAFAAASGGAVGGVVLFTLLSALFFVLWFGFFMVHPNEAKVLSCSANTWARPRRRACAGPTRCSRSRLCRSAFATSKVAS